MPGTRKGALKAAKTAKIKYGNNYHARLGSKGGSAPHVYRPFSADPELAVRAAKIKARIERKRKERQLT